MLIKQGYLLKQLITCQYTDKAMSWYQRENQNHMDKHSNRLMTFPLSNRQSIQPHKSLILLYYKKEDVVIA